MRAVTFTTSRGGKNDNPVKLLARPCLDPQSDLVKCEELTTVNSRDSATYPGHRAGDWAAMEGAAAQDLQERTEPARRDWSGAS